MTAASLLLTSLLLSSAVASAQTVWVHTKAFGVTSSALACEVVLDFMYWPFPKRRFGLFIEPGYEYSFARGHERSIGLRAGLLMAIPRRRSHKH